MHGFAFPGEHIHDEPLGDVLLTPGNFAIGGGFKGDKLKYYDGCVPEEFVLNPGDLVLTMTDLSKEADTLGYPAIIPRSSNGQRFLHNQRIGKVTVTDASLDVRYLYYLLQTREYRNEVLAGATGTTVKHTSPTRISRFRFCLPPLKRQVEIARILGGLDDKVELNRRLSETLERIAQELFSSSFVNAPSRGPAVSLDEVFEINPPQPLPRGVLAPYVDMANAPVRGHVVSEVWLREAGSGARFVNGDTLLARITPCLENGKTVFVDFLAQKEVGWGSTEFIVLRPIAPLPPAVGYFLARDKEFRAFAIRSMSGTSGRQRVSRDVLRSYQLFLPPEDVLNHFGRQATSVLARVRALSNQSRALECIRDTLVPTLIAGRRMTELRDSA